MSGAPHSHPFGGDDEGLVVEGMTLRAGARQLGPFSFTVETGEVVGVIGRAATGKSLLLSTLAGIARRTHLAGRARVPTPIAMVFQRDALDDSLSVLENVAIAARAAGIVHAERASAGLLERVGLHSVTTKRPHKLSGGQRRRVGLARALVVRPRTLLLDDPTAGLDPQTAQEMLALVLDLSRNAATLFATQDIDVVLPHLRRVLHLNATAGATTLRAVEVARLAAPFRPEPVPAVLGKPGQVTAWA